MGRTIGAAMSSAELEPIALDGCDDRRRGLAEGFPPRPSNSNRRTSQRQRVLLSTLMVDLESDAIIPCRAENASLKGVRLRLPERCFIPPAFWLIAMTGGLAYKAKVKWRRDDRMGVSVEEPVDLSDPVTLTERRLHKIWQSRR